jgi:hypothetical protein
LMTTVGTSGASFHRGESSILISIAFAASLTTACASGSLNADADAGADPNTASDASTDPSVDASVPGAADAGSSNTPDAAVVGSPDAALEPVACNPVTQTGCNSGDKCAQVVQSATPFVAQTTCVPNGVVAAGSACTAGAPGATGYDNCAAGLDCSGGVCSEICGQGPPDTCSGSSSGCVQFEDLFDDVAGVGLCVPVCDPVAQDCPVASDACYLQTSVGTATCANVPAPAAAKLQNDSCYGPSGGGCYLNGCGKGYGSVLNNDPVTPTAQDCAFFCNPTDTFVDTGNTPVGTAAGDPNGIDCAEAFGGTRPDGPGAGHECRYIQSFYNNTELVPVTVGMCVAAASWGSCEDFDKPGFLNAVSTNDTTYCDPSMQGGVDLCPPGCVANATLDAWLP